MQRVWSRGRGDGEGNGVFNGKRGDIFIAYLTQSPLTPATQVTITPSKCYFHQEPDFHAENENGGTFWGLGCAVLKGNRKYICFITSLFPTIVWCLLRACVLHDVLQPTKHGGPAAGILLSAIYKPFITLACLLSRLFPYHWWQYILLIVNLNEMQEKTYLKVVLLGKVNSGKTCLVTRYITRSFSEETPSVSKFFSSAIFNFSFNFWLLYV